MTETDSLELIKDDVKVEWVNLGEGWNGDYNPDNPEDTNLLRFDVSCLENGLWCPVEDASYCTQVPASTPEPELRRLLQVLLDEVYSGVHGGHSVKKLCERLSWIKPGDLTSPV